MSIRRKFSNTSDLVDPLQSTILCEYYLWVRWCNIREVNGYYIYNGMKGNKLSFVHQQNSNLIIYFHTISTDIHSNSTVENTYSFFSSNSYFMPQSSIPENREDDNNKEFKLNLAIDSPSSSSSMRHDTSPKFSNIITTTSSNNSTPVSSPPQSPNHKYDPSHTHKTHPRLTPKNSIDEYLYNHWVIKHDNHILYYTKDKDSNAIDNEYPPSYGWKYNEKNASNLPKQYGLMNFGAPPPGITRIPIIPGPMITFDNESGSGSGSGDKNGIYTHGHGNFKNGSTNNGSIGNGYEKSVITFDWPVHFIDVMFKLEPKQPLPFEITVENPNSNILQISNINVESMAYKVGLQQGDILISLNEEEMSGNENIFESIFESSGDDETFDISMTVCRRIYDHIMIIVDSCSSYNKCNGKYYFHHLDSNNSPVFMQDMDQQNDEYKTDNNNNTFPMIIRKAHYVNETGESLWTISNKSEDFYVGLSIDMMPPNTNWECVIEKTIKNNNIENNPKLIFYNGNRKMKLRKNSDAVTPSINKSELLESFAPPSKSYLLPTTHYRRPSWKKNQTPWNMELIIEDEEMNDNNNNNNNNKMNDINENDEWKLKYFTLYENLEDLNQEFYEYWLVCNKYKNKIDTLKDVISQFQNRFIMVRKELFEQKRREEDLLDKINSLQTHSRQVSSISALFDDEYKLDIEELQELAQNINNDDDEKKRTDSVKISNEKLDRITLKTEIDDLNVQLKAKDIKIRELEIDISSWQETHSQIYDSFTSATKKYGEQVEKFNEQEKYYQDKNQQLQSEFEKLQKQLTNISKSDATRDSFDSKDITKRRYTDIDAELEYNSDSSSSVSDIDNSDDSIGGGTHVRRSSKPWMQIKQKLEKKRKKEEKEKNNIQISTPITPHTPVTPITPLSTDNNQINKNQTNVLLSPANVVENNDNNNNNNGASPFLKTLVSQQEDIDLDNNNNKALPIPGIIETQISGNSDADGKLMSRTERLTQRGLNKMDTQMTLHTEISAITPDVGGGDDGKYAALFSQQIPTQPTILHTHQARSKVGDSILNGFGGGGGADGNASHPMLATHLAQSHLGDSMQLSSKIDLLAFRDSNASLFGRDSALNIDELIIMQEKANTAQKWEEKYKNITDKYEKLEIENEQIISSKIKLLHTTSNEIERLKNILNVLVSNCRDSNIRGVIAQMLKSK